MISVQSLLPSATTIVDSTTLPTALPPVAAPNDDEEDTCPVCYESFPPASATTHTVSCKVCKHAVCGSCEEMLKQAGHMRCPMCRAPARPAMPLHMAIHAYHCTDLACERPHCFDAKLLLLRIERHLRVCAALERRGSEECKVCKLWRALQNSQTPRDAPSSAEAASVSSPPLLPSFRPRLRELPPVQVKRMLIAHVRQCRNRQCGTCHKMREYIRGRTQPL